MVWRQGDEAAIINLTRQPSKGEFQPEHAHLLAPYMPHLRRAVGLAGRLPDWRGHTGEFDAGLAEWPAAVLVLDGAGRMLYANAAAEHTLSAQDGLRAAHGVMSAADPATTRQLGAAIARAAAGDMPTGGSLAVKRPSGRRPYAVQIAPCRPERTGLFPSPARVVVTIVDLDAESGPDRETLRALFGLTTAQASVAALLARGRDLRDIAATLGISLYTVRRHLSDVMAKTDTNSQVALVYLLSRLSRDDAWAGGVAARH